MKLKKSTTNHYNEGDVKANDRDEEGKGIVKSLLIKYKPGGKSSNETIHSRRDGAKVS